MRRVLFELFGIPIPSYGAALALAFTIGIAIAYRRARRRGLDPLALLDAALIVVVTALVGARLLWVAPRLDRFRPPHGTWTDVFSPWQSSGEVGIAGLSMMAGVALAVVATLLFFRWRRLPALRYADVMAPSVAFGEGVTRIGCFLNGCCFGTVCHLPWGVTYPEGSIAASLVGRASLHPAQLYTALTSLALFGLLSWMLGRPLPPGSVLFAYLTLSSLARLAIDQVRFYERVEVLSVGLFEMTVHQLFTGGLLAGGVLGWMAVARRAPEVGAPPGS